MDAASVRTRGGAVAEMVWDVCTEFNGSDLGTRLGEVIGRSCNGSAYVHSPEDRLQVSKEALTELNNAMKTISSEEGGKRIKAAGGVAANALSAFCLASESPAAKIIGIKPTDRKAQRCVQELTQRGIDCSGMITQDAETFHCQSIYAGHGRIMRTYADDRSRIKAAQLQPDFFEGLNVVFLEGMAVKEQGQLVTAAQMAHENNVGHVVLLLTGEWFIQNFYADHKQLLQTGHVTTVFGDLGEWKAMAQAEEIDGILAWIGEHCPHLCAVITNSDQPICIHTGSKWGSEVFSVPVVPVKAEDDTGAGDAFAGTFMALRAEGHDARTCLHAAAYVAREVVQHMGAHIPVAHRDKVKQEVQAIKNQFVERQ